MSDLVRRIEEAAGEIPGISVLLVFGSRARERPRRTSDLDVAVLPAAPPEGVDDRRFRLQLQRALDLALSHLAAPPERRVDVLFLDEAPVIFRQRVMEHGRMVICRDPAAWKALRVATMKEWGDSEWARTLYQRELAKRLREGRPSGRSARTRTPLERARRLSRQPGGLPPVQP
jgi:predicted nucleotidyltransferase